MNTGFLAHGPLPAEILRGWDCVEASTAEWLVINSEVVE